MLWIHYEDLKEDIRGMVKRISEFLDIGVGDEALLDLVVEQVKFEILFWVFEWFEGEFRKHEETFVKI